MLYHLKDKENKESVTVCKYKTIMEKEENFDVCELSLSSSSKWLTNAKKQV